MSSETKQAAETVKQFVKEAETYLEAAKKVAPATKDPGLVKKVEKLHQETKEVGETLKKKLDPEQG
jgi:hypothetical protein